MTESLHLAIPFLHRYRDQSPATVWPEMLRAMQGDRFALSALDMAAHDWRGKQLGIPTWKDWGLDWEDIPSSSFTIGIDSLERRVQKLQEMPGWPIYKIKLGSADEMTVVEELRKHTDAIFRVDANCSWTVDQVISYSRRLAELGVEFIEQPLPIDASPDEKRRARHESALPLIADEDCQIESDVPKCAEFYHGVNVKICKCGGLSPALQMLKHARELGLQTMIGCMVESEIGISAAAQLAPLLDHADLDGAALLRETPCSGLSIVNGLIPQSCQPGCGAELHLDQKSFFL